MREIKFRAWDREIKKTYQWEELIEQMSVIFDLLNGRRAKHCNKTLLEYTGLKDKSGKEIYEGDIVGYKEKLWGKEVTEVAWGLAGGVWSVPDANGFYLLSELLKKHKCEIIGNIYENKELLK